MRKLIRSLWQPNQTAAPAASPPVESRMQLEILEAREVPAIVSGVAAGDVTQDAAVLWTRSDAPGNLTFRLSSDPTFATKIDQVAVVNDALLPVKVEFTNLTADTQYFYQAIDADGKMASGTFNTAAKLGTNSGFRLGVTGDWRGELAPYPAVSNADEANLDLFVLHGDTIYADFPSPALVDGKGVELDQAVSVEDYRRKHAEVYSDDRFGLNINTFGDLRGSTAILATIDDHEVINDFSGGQKIADDARFGKFFPGDDPDALINDSTLYENGLQVFQEYNPFRDEFYGETGDARTANERKLYRSQNYGSDAAVFVLDNRSFRDAPITPVSNPADQASVGKFLTESFDPTRTMLGRVQLDDLKADLLQADRDGVVWKFILVPEPIQNLGVLFAADRFEGYAAERREILQFINQNSIDNVVFIAADIHGTVVNNLTYQETVGGPQIATNAFEITTGSGAFDAPFGPTVVQIAVAAGLLPADQAALYATLPRAQQDLFIENLINQQLSPLGYDPVGLESNLGQANGRINANLVQGGWVATQTYGWTEFDIDPTTGQLTVTTYGIDAYDRDTLEADPAAVAARTPQIISQFTVDPVQTDEFTLQILHASDLEGGLDALEQAPNFAAIVDFLEETHSNTVLLSAGDNYIPGPFFNAAGDPAIRTTLRPVYDQIYNVAPGSFSDLREGPGRADATIMNILEFDASALGNHEFDAGTGVLGSIISPDIRGDKLSNVRWLGTQFPYLSANLDFSADANLRSRFTSKILPNTDFISDPFDLANAGAVPKIAPATIIERDGQMIGVVGATTPLLESISSTGLTDVRNPGAGTNDMAALASILQPVVDEMLALGINKVILVSHLQQFALEQQLAGLLRGVDVIIAGGSDTLLADAEDIARGLQPGATADGDYPFVTTNANNDPTVIVSTDGEYSYVGRLVVTFDANGKLLTDRLDSKVNGAFASTDAVVTSLWGNTTTPFQPGTKGNLVQQTVNGVEAIVTARDSQVFGETTVYLNGLRESVRVEETNLGNLTADANLAAARAVEADVAFSIKNGGGIRDAIGTIIEPETGTFVRVPPQANPLSGKEEGQISQLDIENSLRFNNLLSVLTLSATDVLAILEHAVSATAPGATPGQFPQVGGLAFSFDPSRPAGDRVRSVTRIADDGTPLEVIVQDGEIVGDPERTFRVVTLNFLADGGDGYPFDELGTDRLDLTVDGTPGGAALGEQVALQRFLTANFPIGGNTPFNDADTPIQLDRRIQNLSVRDDGILPFRAFSGLTEEFTAPTQPGALPANRFDAAVGDFNIAGGNLTTANQPLNLVTANAYSVTDTIVAADVSFNQGTGNSHIGLVARYQGEADQSMYLGLIARRAGVFTAEIWKNVNGVWTMLDQGSLAGTPTGGNLEFRVFGSSLRLFFNGGLVAETFDGDIQGPGLTGVRGNNTVVVDNFTLNDAPSPNNVTLNPVGGPQVSTVLGGFSTGTNFTATEPGLNIAVFNGGVYEDVVVAGNVALGTGTPTQVGLIARYRGAGDNDLVVGLLVNRGSGVVGEIWEYVDGAYRRIASSTASGIATQGNLQLSLVGPTARLSLDGQELAAGVTRVLGTGLVGFRGTVGASAQSLTFNLPANTTGNFTADFNGADTGVLGPNFVEVIGNFDVVNQSLTGTAAPENVVLVSRQPVQDVEVRANVVADNPSENIGLVARYGGRGPTDHYLGLLANRSDGLAAEIWRFVDGLYTRLTTTAVTANAGELIFRMFGSQLTLSYAGVEVGTVTDSSILNGGLAGVRSSANATLDDLTVTPLTSLPLADDFNRAELGNNFTASTGLTSLTNNTLTLGTEPVSVVISNNAAFDDGIVRADVDVAGNAPSHAGVIARYLDDQNYVLGLLARRGDTFAAEIWEQVDGVFRLLAAAPIGNTSSGRLGLEVSGNFIGLTLDGNLLVQAVGSQDPVRGLTGVRGSAGKVFDNFSVDVV